MFQKAFNQLDSRQLISNCGRRCTKMKKNIYISLRQISCECTTILKKNQLRSKSRRINHYCHRSFGENYISVFIFQLVICSICIKMAQEFQARIVYRHSKVICLKKESSKIIFQIVARSLRVKPFVILIYFKSIPIVFFRL